MPDVTIRTEAFVTADSIHTLATVMTSTFEAVVNVNFATETLSSSRASALEIIDQIVAGAAVEARVGIAVIDVVLVLVALIPFRTLATEVAFALQVCARAPVQARVRVAIIDPVLTI